MDAKRFTGSHHTASEVRCLISRDALLHNVALLRRTVGPLVKLCAIVKANAYGHDAGIVCDTLCHYCTDDLEAPLIDAVAVADLEEAAALPDFPVPLLVLRPIENVYLGRQRAIIEHAIRDGWVLTLCSPAAADDLSRVASACGVRANVQIMLDTGMTRAGVDCHGFGDLYAKVSCAPSLRLTGIYSHFACAETHDHPVNVMQLQNFLTTTAEATSRQRLLRHISNSGAIFNAPNAHMDMVRPGISLYGIDPSGKPCLDRKLRPALRWTAPVLAIRDVPAGVGVGYSQTFVTNQPSRIGLVPVGYADGYLRAFSNRAAVMVHGKPMPVVGNVSMDMITIDLTNAGDVNAGDEVTLLDDDPLSPASVYKLAALAGTIPYEILCRIGQRVKRLAVEATSLVQTPIRPEPVNE